MNATGWGCLTVLFGFSVGLSVGLAVAPAAAADAGPAEEAVEDAGAPDFDVTFELLTTTDYYDNGITQTDHKPAVQPTLSFSYGSFYGSVYGSNVDYGTPDPDLELEFQAGVAPTVGSWTFDLSVTRYDYPNASEFNYTYVFGQASYDFGNGLVLGAGYAYYWYDESTDLNELYAEADYTFENEVSLHAEATYDIDFDAEGSEYLELIGGVSVPLPKGFTASANIGLEHFLQGETPSYVWFDVGASYAVTDWASVDLRYYGNGLSEEDCTFFSTTDCDHRVVASLTLTQSLSALAGSE